MNDAAQAPAAEARPGLGESELAAERARGRIAGAGAVAAGFVFGAGLLWSQTVNSDAPSRSDKPAAALRFTHDHINGLVASTALQAAGMLLLAAVAIHLYRATKARRPGEQQIVAVTGIYGPVMLGVSTLVAVIVLGALASDFVKQADQSKDAADEVFKKVSYAIPGAAGLSGALALVFWFVKGSYDAMRVGLLSRAMGAIGIALGPALLFGIGQLLLPFWLVALGFMFFGVWPGGRPEAWETGRATEWQGFGATPPGTSTRVGGDGPGGERNGQVEAVGPGVKVADEGEEDAALPAAPPRKRKRRHSRVEGDNR